MSSESLILPSGYVSARQMSRPIDVGPEVLPWLDEPMSLSVAKCILIGGVAFAMASTINSHPKLVSAAEAMTTSQRTITDNMFYSRIAAFVQTGVTQNIETMPNIATDFPIKVMRNKGGQRVYFAAPELTGRQYHNVGRIILRLAVCDKNKQRLVMSVLSTASDAKIKKAGR